VIREQHFSIRKWQPKRDALTIEPATGRSGWLPRLASSRGPRGRAPVPAPVQVGGHDGGRADLPCRAVQVDGVARLEHPVKRRHALGQLAPEVCGIEVPDGHAPELQLCRQGRLLFSRDPPISHVLFRLKA